VVGIFRTGLPEVDEGLVHIPITTARSWLGADGAVTTVGAILPNSRVVPEVVRTLRSAIGDDDIRVLGWREAYPELDAAVRIDDYGDYVFHGILFAIIALAVLNTVLMAVLYRKREFGVLQALGLTPAETGLMVFTEGLLLTALAGVVGMILGVAVTWGFFRDGLDFSALMSEEFTFSGIVMDTVVVPDFRMVHVFQSFFSIAVVGIVASIYPAYHATKIDVGEALKFE
jgi:ABC-type lipoprotein release transport system permease subunit